ncbi:MAG: gamma-glutamyltransferase, partial [Bryobacteraceae bacterium]
APSQELIAKGFAVRKDVVAAVQERAAVIRALAPAAAHFLPGGHALQEGQIWHRPGMEWTLERLASAGWQDFYHGEIAGKIADHLARTGGILTRADLAAYQAHVAPAVEIRCGEAHAFTAPLANGGVSAFSAMLMLHELKAPRPSDPMHWHLLAEVMKIVWRDRLRYLGDPAKAKIDWERLLRSSYVDERVAKLRKSPHSVDAAMSPPPAPGPGTIHISTADGAGNIVAITISHGGSFGSCVTVPGTGITLGHGMCRFDPHSGLPNSVAPGKRPLNNVCPMILRQPGRDVGFGMRGGRRIVSVIPAAALQLLQGGELQEVAASARLHTEGYEPILTAKLPPAIAKEMEKMGHHLTEIQAVGGTTNFVSRSSDGRLESASTAFATGV